MIEKQQKSVQHRDIISLAVKEGKHQFWGADLTSNALLWRCYGKINVTTLQKSEENSYFSHKDGQNMLIGAIYGNFYTRNFNKKFFDKN